MKQQSRRQFLKRTAIGAVICSFVPPWESLLAAQQGESSRYDLLVRGGHVVDPSQGLSAIRDVAISAGRLARIGSEIDEGDATRVLDARGKIVTPGLIDVHVHVYEGVAPLGIPADPTCIAKGVTAVLDAGSAGAHTFPGLRRNVINVVDTTKTDPAAERLYGKYYQVYRSLYRSLKDEFAAVSRIVNSE